METKKHYQAAAIDNSQKDYRPTDWKNYGKNIRDGYLEQKIAEVCGEKQFAAYKLLMFLTGSADGFRIAEKTACERCSLSERGYRNARKFLKENNLIRLTPDNRIEVNYEAIYNHQKQSKDENFETLEDFLNSW